MKASLSNGDKRTRTSPVNGAKSGGAKTPEGIFATALAKITHGILSWTPVLPTENEQEWQERLAGILKEWQPKGTTEEELVYGLAISLWQRRRLYRYEQNLILSTAKAEASGFPDTFEVDAKDEIPSALNGGQAERRKEIAVCETVLSLLQMLRHEPGDTPVHGTDALLLLERILASVTQGVEFPPLSEPEGGWTFGAIREAVNELASDCGKRPAALLKSAHKQAREELESKQYALESALRHVERAAVPAGYQNHDAARLWDYDRRTLNTIVRLINTLERRQALRRGLPVSPAAALDVTVTHSVDANT
jgi:hypothetical protein